MSGLTATVNAAAAITAGLRLHRLRLKDERTMQDDVGDWLAAHGWSPQREFQLSGRGGRIDFACGPFSDRLFVGLELKLKGRKRALVDQLLRYSESPELGALIVVSSLRVALPPAMDGTPLYYVSPGLAHL